MSWTGILPVNKPRGVRSTECVEKIKRALGKKVKIGHGGTLDSTASGVLILLTGHATRFSNFIMALPKCYETEITLGRTTSTDDASGDTLEEQPFHKITNEMIDLVLPAFHGWRMQKPPMISAVHVDGKRAHARTRSGESPDIKAKPVFFKWTQRTSDVDDLGRVSFRLLCSKGTYVRSFARDLGEKLGCGAHVSILERRSVGPFFMESAPRYENLIALPPEAIAERILPCETLLKTASSFTASENSLASLRNGNPICLTQLRRIALGDMLSDHFLIVADGVFSICTARPEQESLTLKPTTNIFFDGAAKEK